MRVLVVSNCVTPYFTKGLQLLFPDWVVKGVVTDVAEAWLRSGENSAFEAFVPTVDLFVGLPLDGSPLDGALPTAARRVTIPAFFFRGLHPDSFHLEERASVLGAGTLYSRIATVACLIGLSERQCAAAFRSEIYERLGYFDAFAAERELLLSRVSQAGIDLSAAFEDWAKDETPFLYTYNHPRPHVLADLLAAVLPLIGASHPAPRARLETMPDADYLGRSIVWPVYPDIAARHGLKSAFVWRKGERANLEPLDLHQFIAATYRALQSEPPHRDEISDFEKVAMALHG